MVIAHETLPWATMEHSIRVVMTAAMYGRRHSPDDHLLERPVIEVEAIALEELGLHVGNYVNSVKAPLIEPTDGSASVDRSAGTTAVDLAS